MASFDLKAYLSSRKRIVDEALDLCLPLDEASAASRVVEAMRYSLLGGGKRLRPILVMAGAEIVGASPTMVLPAACALECIHTYSLIHDDLPAMDDDDLRRGRPTCHKIFGEAVAILAGDGLLTHAFDLMAHPDMAQEIPPELRIEAIRVLAAAAGFQGMVGGQTADILNEGKNVDASTLAFIHRHKTGALITGSLHIGGLLAGGNPARIQALTTYGNALGLAFQIVDDLLDVVGDEKILGKPVGSDARKKKATYPGLFGIEKAREQAAFLLREAESALEPFDERAAPLRALARYVVERDR